MPYLKKDSPKEVVDAIQRVEDRADECFRTLGLLTYPADLSDLLISRNLRCPQLVDQLEFRIGEDRGGGVELIAQIADRFIVGGVREMMQSHGQGFVLKIWN